MDGEKIGVTREEILAMAPGPELDELVRGGVFRWVFTDNRDFCGILLPPADPPTPPPYSTDIAAAWQVVEKMREKGFRYFHQEYTDGLYCVFVRYGSTIDDTPFTISQWDANRTPEAICKASLLCVMEVNGGITAAIRERFEVKG